MTTFLDRGENTPSVAGLLTVSGLSDTVIVAPVSQQVLTYNQTTSDWRNADSAAFGLVLNDINDVSVAATAIAGYNELETTFPSIEWRYRAQDTTCDISDNVSAWPAKKKPAAAPAEGYDAATPLACSIDQYGNRSIRFSAADQRLLASSSTLYAKTFVMFCRLVPVSSNGSLLFNNVSFERRSTPTGSGAVQQAKAIFRNTATSIQHSTGLIGTSFAVPSGLDAETGFGGAAAPLVILSIKWTASGQPLLRVNPITGFSNTAIGSWATTTGNGDTDVANWNRFVPTFDQGGVQSFQMDLYELLIFNEDVSNTDMSTIENALTQRYFPTAAAGQAFKPLVATSNGAAWVAENLRLTSLQGNADAIPLGVGLGSNAVELKCNFSASAAPSASDDITAGYRVGSRWIDTTAGQEHVCVDSTANAAVWKQTTV